MPELEPWMVMGAVGVGGMLAYAMAKQKPWERETVCGAWAYRRKTLDGTDAWLVVARELPVFHNELHYRQWVMMITCSDELWLRQMGDDGYPGDAADRANMPAWVVEEMKRIVREA